MKLSCKQSLILLFLTSFLLLFVLFKDIILAPNSYLFSSGGDGIKNYYTLSYYVKYGEGTNFIGMNYPYGEHVVYTDCQPLLAFILNWINTGIIDISNYTTGILNLIMIFSVIPCIFFIYLILGKYYLPKWYAIICAIIIGFLSPQFSRLTGHYSLAYMFYVPLVWYLIIRLSEKNNQWKWFLFINITILIFSFIHPYYLLIGTIFLLFYLLIYSLFAIKHLFNEIGFIAKGVLTAVVPILIFKVFFLLTDNVDDRPLNPYGIYAYTASFESVFFSVYPPLIDIWRTYINIKGINWEGYAYVGFVGFLVLIFSFIKLARYFLKKQYHRLLLPGLPGNLTISLWAAVLVLLFSMAFPFRLGLDFLLDWLPPLKQFRSLGRLSWVFYYVFTVYSAFYIYLIYRYLHRRNLKRFAIVVMILCLFLWGAESYINVNTNKKYIIQYKTAHDFFQKKKNYTEKLKKTGYLPKDFQAILPLPYLLMGSEKFYIHRSGTASYEAMKASYDTGLPLVTGMLSRTSISQSTKLLQLLSNENIEKKIIRKFKNNKPLLLIATNETLNENELIKKAQLIYKDEQINIYQLPLLVFQSTHDKINTYFESGKDSFYFYKNYWITDSKKRVVINSFNNDNAIEGLSGQGALYKKEGVLQVYDSILPNIIASSELEVSCWLKIDKRTSGFPIFYYEQYDTQNKMIDKIEINPKFLMDVYKDWVRINHIFTLSDRGNRVKIYFEGEHITIDELLIKPREVDVFYNLQKNKSFTMNNFPIRKD